MPCTFCDRPAITRGMCAAHYARERRYGDPLHEPEHRAGPLPGPRVNRRKGDPGDTWHRAYCRAHALVMRTRGPAAAQPCVDCGTQAYAWSYTYEPGELHLPNAYGTPERYQPRCRGCHARYDVEHRTGQGALWTP